MMYCCIIVILSFIVLSVDAAWMSEIPHAPSRVYSKLFNIPSWIAHIRDYNEDAFNATTIFSVVTILFSTAYALYYIYWVYYPSCSPGNQTIGPFNSLILLYLISTSMATSSFSVMNVGRIWASFGVYHNLFEVALLSHVMLRHMSLKEPRFVLTCFVYLLVSMFVVIIAPWPLDALFFKYQGLSVDFVLSINLGRLYKHNKNKYEQENSKRKGKSCNDQLLEKQTNASSEQDHDKLTQSNPHTNIQVIYIASLLHALGNTLVTFSNHFSLWVIFQFTYAVSFPMYAYYLIVEPNSSRISWYKINYKKESLAVLSGVILAGLCIALGIYNADIHCH